MAKRIKQKCGVVIGGVVFFLCSLMINNEAPAAQDLSDSEYFNTKYSTLWKDAFDAGEIFNAGKYEIYWSVINDEEQEIIFIKDAEKIAVEGSFYITDASKTKSNPIKIKGAFKYSAEKLLFVGDTQKLGIIFEAVFVPHDDFIEVAVRVKDTTGKDRAITVEYALNIDAIGWKWWDDVRNSRVISEKEEEYSNTTKIFVGRKGEMSFYPFSCISSADHAFSYGIPLNRPRVSQIYYDTASKRYEVGFDFALTQKTDKFPGEATCFFIIYAPDAEWGFREAARDYYRIYPSFFEKRVEREGIWMPFTSIKAVENSQDFHFAFHEYGNTDIGYNNLHQIYSLRYLEPWTYWMDMNSDVARQYDKAIELLKGDAASDDTRKKKMSQATLLSGVYDKDGKISHDFLDTPWCKGVVFSNNTDPDIKHKENLEYNAADISFEIAKDEVIDEKVSVFQGWDKYVEGYEPDEENFHSSAHSLKVARNNKNREYGAKQIICLNQSEPLPIVFGGYSKANNVSGVKDAAYSIYIDIAYNDDTYCWGNFVAFDTGSHDWQYSQKFIYPEKPVKSANVHLLFRGEHTGEAWFDDIFVKETGENAERQTGIQVWNKYAEGFEVDENISRSGGKSIFISKSQKDFAGGARQELKLNQKEAVPIKISGWSKAENVTGDANADYSIYADVIYMDDTPLYGITANFNGGSHDWECKELLLEPKKPIKTIMLNLLFRGEHTGTVWFDDISAVETGKTEELIVDTGFEKLFSEKNIEFANLTNLLENSDFEEGNNIDLRIDGIYLDSLEGWAKRKNFCQEHFKYVDIPLAFDTYTKKPLILNAFSVYEFTKAMSDYMHENNRLLMANWVVIDFPFYTPLLDIPGKEVNWLNYQNAYQPDSDSIMNYRRALSYQKPFLLLLNVPFEKFTFDMTDKYFQRSLFYGMFPSMFSYDAATDPYFENPAYYNRDRCLFIKYIPIIKKVSKAGWQPVTFARTDNENIFIERYGDLDSTLYFTVHNNLDYNQKGMIRIDKKKLLLNDKFAISEILSNTDIDYEVSDENIAFPVSLAGYQTKVFRIIKDDFNGLSKIACEDLTELSDILKKYEEQKKITSWEASVFGEVAGYLLSQLDSEEKFLSNIGKIEENFLTLNAWAEEKKQEELLNQILKVESSISRIKSKLLKIEVDLKGINAVCSPSKNEYAVMVFNNSGKDMTLQDIALTFSPQLKIENIKAEPVYNRNILAGGTLSSKVYFSAPEGIEEITDGIMNAKVTTLWGTEKVTLSNTIGISIVKDIEFKLEPGDLKTFNNKPQFKIFIHNNRNEKINGTLSVIAPDVCQCSLGKETVEIAANTTECLILDIICPLKNERQDYDFLLNFDVEGQERISQKGFIYLFPKTDSKAVEPGVAVKVDSSFAGYNSMPLCDGIIDTKGIVWNEASWASEETESPHWVEITFPSQVSISSVVIHWALDSDKYWVSNKYKIEYWKRSGWAPLDKVSGMNTAETFNKHIFRKVIAKKVRIWQECGGGSKARPNLMWIREIEVLP